MSKIPIIKLEGKSVVLRPLTFQDAQGIQTAANDSEIAKYTPIPYPFSLEDAYKLIDNTRKGIEKEKEFFFGVEFGREMIGMAGILNLKKTERKAEVGYWIKRDYRGVGMAEDALEVVLDFSFGERDLRKVWARVTDGNIPSVKLLERQRFTLVERLPEKRIIDGKKVDDLVYELTAKVYRDSKN